MVAMNMTEREMVLSMTMWSCANNGATSVIA